MRDEVPNAIIYAAIEVRRHDIISITTFNSLSPTLLRSFFTYAEIYHNECAKQKLKPFIC